jgi:hypothetical protein
VRLIPIADVTVAPGQVTWKSVRAVPFVLEVACALLSDQYHLCYCSSLRSMNGSDVSLSDWSV